LSSSPAWQCERQPEPSATIIGKANNLDLHLARDRSSLAISANHEGVIERTQRCLVSIVKSQASRHLKVSCFPLPPGPPCNQLRHP
jgi:hypothetical protein